MKNVYLTITHISCFWFSKALTDGPAYLATYVHVK
ncbi:hypothetical protein OIU79_003676 [Salix purpurea]|uniref:Uncharacterized protein n=1 Tax=Salix purpurea TaxID=77065 RepID=A0A9Q0U8F2_SALPP|nr:hypothetical protein OIU79_003676 [Salix purpurea]